MSLPVTVIGGYLGAGKTTLVNHLLRHARGKRIAVAVNEFGALPIDQDLILGAEGDVLTLAGGCVCCSFGDDLAASLRSLVQRENIDHVLIEASGVALPGAIARSLALIAGFSHEATLVVVDAETVRAQSTDKYIGDTITRQLADADLVLLNKIDLLAPDARAGLHPWLGQQAPGAKIVETRQAQVDPDIALGGFDASAFVCDTPRANHEIADLSVVALEFSHAVDVPALCEALTAPDLGLVRAKGFARNAGGAWLALQIVGRRANHSPTSARTDGTGRIVCIAHGRKVERSKIATLLERFRV